MKNHPDILLVEDEAIIAISQKFKLEKYGYKVNIVDNAKDAIEITEKK